MWQHFVPNIIESSGLIVIRLLIRSRFFIKLSVLNDKIDLLLDYEIDLLLDYQIELILDYEIDLLLDYRFS